MSGRTIRAGMNELFDYGRPASITLVCLLDIGRRELPIQPDLCGAKLSLSEDELIKLSGPQPLTITLARSEEHTSELQSRPHLVCRLLLEKKKKHNNSATLKKYTTSHITPPPNHNATPLSRISYTKLYTSTPHTVHYTSKPRVTSADRREA